MPIARAWVPKPTSPPYVTVTQADIWNTVKEKWTSLGSPAAQCPSPRFGEVGSAENNACREFVAPIWENMESVFPQLPSFGPYNSIQDLVGIGEICALGFYEDPEADIGPAPNLFENPGGLVQKLSEWYLRSLVPTLCEPAPVDPMTGACFCWPYWVTIRYRKKYREELGWAEPETTKSYAFGPIRGARMDTFADPNDGVRSFNLVIEGQNNPGGRQYGTIHDCGLGYQDYIAAGGYNYDDAEFLSIVGVEPFTAEECSYYGHGYAASGPNSDGYCPVPDVRPPMPPLPNATPIYMPLPVPTFSFPPGNSCPPPGNNMDFTVNLISIPGPPGIDGIQGKDGKDGPTMIETILKTRQESQISENSMGGGYKGGVVYLPRHCAYVRIRFNVGGATQENYSDRRIFFEPADSWEKRKEIGLGNAYLRLTNSDDATLERIQLSMENTLIAVPKCPQNESWQLVVNDKGDVGYEVIDLGYRHVLRKVDNPENVGGFEYYEPTS